MRIRSLLAHPENKTYQSKRTKPHKCLVYVMPIIRVCNSVVVSVVVSVAGVCVAGVSVVGVVGFFLAIPWASVAFLWIGFEG